MEFQVHTIYDSATVRELQDLINGAGKERRKKTVRRNVLALGVVCLAGAAVSAVAAGNDVLAIVLLLAGILLLSIGAVFPAYLTVRQDREDRKNGKRQAQESDVCFSEDGFLIRNRRGERNYTYQSCLQLLEGPRHFVIMLGDTRAVALDKDGFLAGDPEEFRAFLEERTGKRWERNETTSIQGPDGPANDQEV